MTEMAEGLPSASGEKHGCARAPCTRVQTQTYAPRQMPPMSTALPTSAFRGMAHTPPRACMLPRSPLTTTHPTLLSHLCGPGMDIPAQLCPPPASSWVNQLLPSPQQPRREEEESPGSPWPLLPLTELGAGGTFRSHHQQLHRSYYRQRGAQSGPQS